MDGIYDAPSPELLEEVGGFSPEQLEDLRDMCRNELYFLASGILGYRDLNLRVHGEFCRHLQNCPKRRRLGLMPRGHLKSTINVADCVRLALLDPQDCRILLASETATLAEKFLFEIKNHFQTNQLLQGLFPELIPQRFAGPGVVWRSDQATINRSSPWKDPTWQAIGVGGASVGSHFTRIKCDDLVGFDAARSPAIMAYTKAWNDSIEPLLVTPSQDIIDWIGTRWSRNDLYGSIMSGYGTTLGVYTRSAIEGGQLIFPEKLSWEEVERIQRINPAQWAAQYDNNPLSSTNSDFLVSALRHFHFTDGEQAVRLDNGKKWWLEECDRVLTVDPNSGSLVAPDTAAISVTAYTPDEEVCTLESWAERCSPDGLVDQTYNFARKWKVRVVGIEKAGQQNTDFYFKQKAQRENYTVQVEHLNPKGGGAATWERTEGKKGAKKDRIRAALGPIIKSGLLFTLPSQTALRQQLTDFPDCLLWDDLDALGYAPSLWRRPERSEVIERRQDVQRKILMRRNVGAGRTGY